MKTFKLPDELVEELVRQELTECLEVLEAEIEAAELDMESGSKLDDSTLAIYGYNVMYRNAMVNVLRYYEA